MKGPLAAAGLLLTLATGVRCDYSENSSLPIVDLHYERHQAISFNESGGTYNFSNIRYAQAPVGDLRFRLPKPPVGKSSVINNGSTGYICPQATPSWETIAAQFLTAYLTGSAYNITALESEFELLNAFPPAQDPRSSEDCLFLDVIAPATIFNRTASNSRTGAPVLVWIYGGGYGGGEKTGGGEYNPAGLLEAAKTVSGEQFVFVALNYRLGAFGWGAGPTIQSDGVANAGLYDQLLALQWIQDNIHLFGGDKSQVTVMGESAGAGSILHQITAFGGLKGRAPFKRAIMQSPAWQPLTTNNQQELLFQSYLHELGVSTITEARNASTEDLIAANAKLNRASPWGSFNFGPALDGLITPQLPGRLLLQGSYDHDVEVMVGHNADEGLIFTNPNLTSTSDWVTYLKGVFPAIQPDVILYIIESLYPPIYDGSQNYTTDFQRATLATSEAVFTCNTEYIDRAFKNKTYAYEFAVPPGLHGFDVPYTFANGPSVSSPKVAEAMQQYIAGFVMTGTPEAKEAGVPKFVMYGGQDQEVIFSNDSSIALMQDGLANPRCTWWQKALYA